MIARTLLCTWFLLYSTAWAVSPTGSSARVHATAAASGPARVSSRGELLGLVTAGSSFSYAMMQALTRAGCLVYKDSGFLLQVDDSPEVLQLQGPDLAANVGNRVEVTGTRVTTAATIAPAASVLDVTSVAPRSTGGCLTVAVMLNAQTTAPQQPAAPGAKPVPGAKPAPRVKPAAPAAKNTPGAGGVPQVP